MVECAKTKGGCRSFIELPLQALEAFSDKALLSKFTFRSVHVWQQNFEKNMSDLEGFTYLLPIT